ncbi:efflux RND transporter permease subunit [Commensalibacter papalotli (ex Botero et al. 2024)]|uniref:Multidrug efflux pump subunit AcrB (AcrB) (PDB:1IWG) n=1 Tax=Commensalibacter papalotli (ex Botero et al. 2024) TaxID=2972766 RepID=A0ABM9HNB3_9PROT|nr:efflux RND transporter permease subunit [Commensalibacter papalotli (ex Botero et al. 2024)]CAI3937769.1 Multidrug efflux pump subunit AcrB (AcrB) (PDB:1IWG) [Commensalibacter papalotli (ex Botero et al. 2024)]CAI3937868.1 Multidrug efflux pump subunit AcrB (AcrB) (PDB:1IWG) [Commensalibacter papalotli (ex Botero et al. 2024)]
MNPSRLFILRPVATTLLMLAILICGILGYRFLPLSALPQVDYPTIVVSTFYPGASSEVMMTSVTAPLETQLGKIPGLDEMTSQSSGGASVITLRFNLNMSMDVASQEVQEGINQANSLLPSDLPTPPIYAKVNPADTPIFTLGITSSTLPLTEVEDYVNTRLAAKISQISGVGLVTLSGGQRKAIRVQMNIPKLTSYGIDLDSVRTTIGNVNVNSPTGNFDGPQRSITLQVNGQIKSPEQLLNQIIAYSNGGPIRLRDVATVVQGPENTQLQAWANKTPALILNVQRQPSANVVNVVDNIKAILPQLENSLPTGISIIPLTDRTITIRASIHDVKLELFLAVLLVIGVIFIFLKNIPATIIPSLSVPLSLIGTLAIMYLLGFSLDNLSLMALTIATGFVVDDAIVMIENISRYIEMGEDRMTAALKGSAEIGFTIISLTISLIAVLIPLLFMGDVIGRLFYEFAVTLSVTIMISAIVSLTLVPMLCARMLKEQHEVHQKDTFFDRLIHKTIALYDRGLQFVFRHQPATLTVTICTLFLTFILAYYIPKGFFPVQDNGILQGMSVMSQTSSLQIVSKKQQELANVILKDPDVVSLSSFIGIDGQNMTINQGRFLVNLKERSKRSATAEEISKRISLAAHQVIGTQLYLQPVQDLSLETSFSATQYQFLLENPDYDQFKVWVPRIVEKLKQNPILTDITSDLQSEGLVANVLLDRTTGARYSITPQTIDNVLYDSFGQRQISTIYTQSNQYRIILESEPKFQKQIKSLSQLYLPGISGGSTSTSGPTRNPTAGLVPLLGVTRVEYSTAPLLLTHYKQFPATTISFNVANHASLGEATRAITQAEKELNLPKSFVTNFQGIASAFEKSLSNELFLIIAAVVAVYIVLGILYESFIHPITILSTLPSAAIGALFALWIDGSNLDIMGIIGIVLLIGIVKKNAIMMIDFALEAERVEKKSPLEAIHQAALLRFRPILMTTLAAMFAAVPMMLGTGTGSELRHPLGVCIFWGLVASQLLTLFTIPVVYLYMERISLWLRKRSLSRYRQKHSSQKAGQ